MRAEDTESRAMQVTRFRIMAVASAALLVAAVVYVAPLARERSQNVALGRQWAGFLKNHPTFSGKRSSPTIDVDFLYADPTDHNLARLRTLYELDAIAGHGPEVERIVNLMRWVYLLTGHANNPEVPKELNAFNLIHLARDEQMQINCYMKTVILSGCTSPWAGHPARRTFCHTRRRKRRATSSPPSIPAPSGGGFLWTRTSASMPRTIKEPSWGWRRSAAG